MNKCTLKFNEKNKLFAQKVFNILLFVNLIKASKIKASNIKRRAFRQKPKQKLNNMTGMINKYKLGACQTGY